jgi:hypothetical protein
VRTKAVERDLCAALNHLLLHRSRTSHRCKCGQRIVWGPVLEPGECPECDEVGLEGYMEDLLADLDVLADFERRIRRHPELVAKIEEVVRPNQLEATIKAVAAVVREAFKEKP